MASKRTGLKISEVLGTGRAEDGFQWEHRPCQIRTASGEIVFELQSAEVPSNWSQQALNIVARQYFRRLLPNGEAETSVRKLVHRVVRSIRTAGECGGYFYNSNDAENFENELKRLILSQAASFNSPVWFNCGLWDEYRVIGSGGNWVWDPVGAKSVRISNVYERPQSSACFIQSVGDSLASIFDLVTSEARLFKFGSGTGTNFSSLRGRQETLSGGGESSGLMSFLDVFDRAAGATKSGGTTRRAAKMVCLDLDHPEIFEFVRWKAKEEAKAQALIRAGFSGGMEGEAYRTVSGQNSNNSVRITKDFLNRVKNNLEWSTRARTTGEVVDTFPARKLWQAIAESAWLCADPGVQYHDTIQSWHTCKTSGPIRASNPCSEFMFLDNTACNLASINLRRFFDEANQFNVRHFCQAVRVLILAQDILVNLSSYPTAEIAENSYRFRPLGLGYANLGATLMSLGLPYDSREGRSWASALTALMGGEAYNVSAELAKHLGPFDRFDENRESMKSVVRRHCEAALHMEASAGRIERSKIEKSNWDEVMTVARASWERAVENETSFGFRNSQVTLLAPTGTIAFMMDCDTTGIEPEFSLVKFKSLAGGGSLTIVNQSVGRGLAALGKSQTEVKELEAILFREGEGAFFNRLNESERRVFQCAQSISPQGHLEMMAAAQPFLSGAISKTVNLPRDASVEDVMRVFELGESLGIKSIAIYRDGSKSAQPLKTKHDSGAAEPSGAQDSLNRCPICSHPTVVSGTCWVCPECGHSLACS